MRFASGSRNSRRRSRRKPDGPGNGREGRPDRCILRVYPDPVLRRTCAPVEEFDAAPRDLAAEMLALMRANHGIGLAAPQVGLSRQLIVAGIEDRTLSLANPRIVAKSGSSAWPEGCLSLPGQRVVVNRDQEIRVSAFDLRGRRVQAAVSGVRARVIEHEIDHLRGGIDYRPCRRCRAGMRTDIACSQVGGDPVRSRLLWRNCANSY